MPRRRSTISLVRTVLYSLAPLLGDLSALRRGPPAMAKRLARRAMGRRERRCACRASGYC